MKKLWNALCLILFSIALLTASSYAETKSTPAPAASKAPIAAEILTSAPTATPVPLAPLATQIGQTIQTLVGTPPTTEAPAGADAIEEFPLQISDSLAAETLSAITNSIESAKENSVSLKAYKSAPSDWNDWMNAQVKDPHRAALWDSISNDLLTLVAPPLLIGCALILFLIPLRLKLKRNEPKALTGRIALLLGLLFLRLIPVFAFLGSVLFLLEQNEAHRLSRVVTSTVVYALSLGFTLQQFLRFFFSPTTPHLRLLPITTPQAASSYRWLSAFSTIIIYAYFLADLMTALRIPASVSIVAQNVFAVLLTGMAIVAILKARHRVASILRGKNEAETETKKQANVFNTLRQKIAAHWHSLATVYLLLSLVITLLGVENSFALMLRGTIVSLAILVLIRFGLLGIEKWKTPSPGGAALAHRQFLAFILRPSLWIAALLGIAAAWGVSINAFFATAFGQRVLGSIISIAVTLSILTILYEILHRAIDRHLSRRDEQTKQPVASSRAITLLPMVRTSVFILFSTIAILTSLSAVGINIAPLLAGAGVLGVAIGFGSQTLVKDFLTGLFIVAENTIAIGDNVMIDTFEGQVEALTIRTIRLRALDGSLHILPFSEVTKITNQSKGFAYALLDVNVAYDSDLERVMKILHAVGEELQQDPVYHRIVLDPLSVMGVQELGSSSISIRVRIRTRPGKQWEIRRQLNLRIKKRFDKEGVEIPFPIMTQLVKMVPMKKEED